MESEYKLNPEYVLKYDGIGLFHFPLIIKIIFNLNCVNIGDFIDYIMLIVLN